MSAEPVSSIPPHVRQPTDRLRAEASHNTSEPVEVPLGERTVQVIPLRAWRSSAISALRAGNFELWASKCLTPETLPVWREVDPTIDEIEALFRDWSTITGQSAPESFASPR